MLQVCIFMKVTRGRQKGIGEIASKALGWSFLNTAVAKFGTFGVGIMLARLLGPHAFGTFAVAYVALLAVLSFNELGVSLAIVRWQGEPDQIVPTVSTISIATSVMIYIGSYLAAPAFAAAMRAPAATDVIRVLAINVIIDGAVAAPAALMQRQFRQGKKMVADQANTWVGAAVSVGLAWAHFGPMSIAIGRLSGALVAAVLVAVFAPRGLRLGFDRTQARALLHFGLPLAGASIVVLAVGQVDQVVVGRILGPTALGYYALALNLASWPVNMFSVPIRSVAPAVFSRLQHDREAMRKGFVSSAGLLGSITLPVCFLIAGAAAPLIHVVYGTQWAHAAQALPWLALLGALRILYEFVYDFFVVLARSRVVFTVQLVWLVVLVPALVIGARTHGIAGTAAAELAVATLVILPWYLTELGRINIKRRALAGQLWLPLMAAIAVDCAAVAVSRVVPIAFLACAISGVIAVIIMGLLAYSKRSVLAELRPVLSRGDGLEPRPTSETDRIPVRVRAGLPVSAGYRTADSGQQAAALQTLLALSMPVAFDMTGPVPTYRDTAWAPPVRRGVVDYDRPTLRRRGQESRPASHRKQKRPRYQAGRSRP